MLREASLICVEHQGGYRRRTGGRGLSGAAGYSFEACAGSLHPRHRSGRNRRCDSGHGGNVRAPCVGFRRCDPHGAFDCRNEPLRGHVAPQNRPYRCRSSAYAEGIGRQAFRLRRGDRPYGPILAGYQHGDQHLFKVALRCRQGRRGNQRHRPPDQSSRIERRDRGGTGRRGRQGFRRRRSGSSSPFAADGEGHRLHSGDAQSVARQDRPAFVGRQRRTRKCSRRAGQVGGDARAWNR